MKKNWFFYSIAVLALSACTNDDVLEENTASNQPKEIAFQAFATPTTRAAVDGTTFPDINMHVAAFDATAGKDYFGGTVFSKASTTWTGDRYWPFSAATINFLAYADFANVSGSFNATHPASEVVLTLGDNKTAQNDLMYACGTGTVTKTGNALGYPGAIGMAFKHAQAWVKFTVAAGNTTSASAIRVNSITLNSVSCQGTYTVTHAGYDGSVTQGVSGTWSGYDTYAGNVVAAAAPGYSALSTSEQDYASLMVVPNQGMASFTINYTVDGNTYDYLYTPASTSLAQATKYTYNITLTVHEIEITPSVTDWTDGVSTAVGL